MKLRNLKILLWSESADFCAIPESLLSTSAINVVKACWRYCDYASDLRINLSKRKLFGIGVLNCTYGLLPC